LVDAFHQEGMTAVKDPDIFPIDWDAYRQLLEQNKLTVRVFVL
jgi:predicted amidohydrolase YtcJ